MTAAAAAPAEHIVVMGVSGSGKTALASRLAARLGYRFCEADEFHPAANIESMSRGTPLTDDDRRPWLESLAAWVAEQDAAGRSTVMACSALKRDYRDVLRAGAGRDLLFIHVTGDPSVIAARMGARSHFMPGSLLASQLDVLEPLGSDEEGTSIDLELTPDAELLEALAWLDSRRLRDQGR